MSNSVRKRRMEVNKLSKRHDGRVWTIANLLTGVRLLLIPPFLYYVAGGEFRIALVLFFIAAVTDSADGYAARKLNQQTALGRLMDPLADKLLTGSAYVVMALPREAIPTIPIWLAVLVVSRDLLILVGAGVVYARTGYKKFKPTVLGKANTFLELGLIVSFLATHAFGRMTFVLPTCYVIIAASIAISAVDYLVIGFRAIRPGAGSR